jgi:cold shock CspA family protein
VKWGDRELKPSDDRSIHTGRIRRFYRNKGYGFIIPYESHTDDNDIFIHHTALKPNQLITAGSMVEFRFRVTPEGRKLCTEILNIDNAAAEPPDFTPTVCSDWTGATVKIFNAVRRYGYVILHDGSGDAYFHARFALANGVPVPREGDKWLVRYSRAPNGRTALVAMDATQTVGDYDAKNEAHSSRRTRAVRGNREDQSRA